MSDPLRDELARNMLEFHCGQAIFCPRCKGGLDARRAVAVDIYDGERLVHTGVLCAPCYDGAKDAMTTKAAEKKLRLDIADGRELWTGPVKLRRVK